MRRAFLVILLLLIAVGAPAESTEPVLNVTADKRLLQKLTYTAKRKPVRFILADLSELTGVTLHAGMTAHDWQVRDRRMNLFVKDVLLADLMQSMAHVMKFKWSRFDKVDPPTYRLYMNRKAVLEGEARREREETKRAENRKDYLDFCLNPPDPSEQELEKMKQDDPARYVLLKTGIAHALADLFKEWPAAAEAFASGQELHLNGSDMSESGRQAALAFVQAVRNTSQIDSSGPMDDRPIDMAKLKVHINRPSLSSLPAFVLGIVRATDDEGGVGLPITDPNSPGEQAMARATIKCMDENRSMTSAEEQQVGREYCKAAFESESAEPEVDRKDDPELNRKVKARGVSGRLSDALDAVANSADVNLVSDCFTTSYGPVGVADGEIELGKLLDGVADPCSYNWEKRACIIEFQDRFWAKRRAAQIPDEWIDAWRRIMKKTGTLDIDSLAKIAMLAPEQLQENLADDEILGNYRVVPLISANQDLLRFYASLTESERAAVFSRNGLDLRSITGDRAADVQALLSRNAAFMENPEAQLTLKGSRKKQGTQFDYSFTAISTGDLEPITWQLRTPVGD